jgi:hypothetical protein
MRRIALALLACLTLTSVCGCATGGYEQTTYVYSQKEAGNIAASDSLGMGLSQHNGVQTAFVPDEN